MAASVEPGHGQGLVARATDLARDVSLRPPEPGTVRRAWLQERRQVVERAEIVVAVAALGFDSGLAPARVQPRRTEELRSRCQGLLSVVPEPELSLLSRPLAGGWVARP